MKSLLTPRVLKKLSEQGKQDQEGLRLHDDDGGELLQQTT
jgi:hypothetical protein